MDTRTTPIASALMLSTMLHAVVLAALLAVLLAQQASPVSAAGEGIQIELVSADKVSSHQQTDNAAQKSSRSASYIPQKQTPAKSVRTASAAVLTVASDRALRDRQHDPDARTIDVTDDAREQQDEGMRHDVIPQKTMPHKNMLHKTTPRLEATQDLSHRPVSTGDVATGNSAVQQSTAASSARHSILDLLHSSINRHKKYPYLARRQGREGTSTVAFVLHPDGSIADTYLVRSSHAAILDRAALSAVEQIAPFTVARDYLERAESFQVDIAFELL